MNEPMRDGIARYKRDKPQRSRILQVPSLIGFLILLSAPASAQTVKAARAAIVFSTAAQAADTITTLRADGWRTREANALVPRSVGALVALKTGVAVFNAIGSIRAAKQHPRLVFWIQVGLGGGFTVVAARNHGRR